MCSTFINIAFTNTRVNNMNQEPSFITDIEESNLQNTKI